jgi:hypothetical protein
VGFVVVVANNWFMFGDAATGVLVGSALTRALPSKTRVAASRG